jgi:hypothetical protein
MKVRGGGMRVGHTKTRLKMASIGGVVIIKKSSDTSAEFAKKPTQALLIIRKNTKKGVILTVN